MTTVPTTLGFVMPPAVRLADSAGFEVTLASSAAREDAARAGFKSVVVPMKRGFGLDGLNAIVALYRVFRRNRFDIVQYSTPNAALYSSIAAWLARVPVRVYAQWGIRYVGLSGVARLAVKLAERLVCALSTTVEPDSQGNLDFSVAEGLYPREKGFVHWNGSAAGVDLTKFNADVRAAFRAEERSRLGIPKSSFVVGFVGRLSRDKGGNELLWAARSLMARGYDIRLMLVGSMEADDVDPRLLSWAEGERRVIKVDWVDDVPRAMAAMDVLALPSYREGFGSVVIEAEALGIPVIVSEIPGPLDAMVPGETGLAVPKGDARALVTAVAELIKSPNKALEMGRAGATFAAERFERGALCASIVERRVAQVSSRGRREPAERAMAQRGEVRS